MKKALFSIKGMSCSACAARVEKVVSALPGVKDVSVNLLKNSLTLSYDNRCNPHIIAETIDKAGFQAFPVTAKKSQDKDKDLSHKEYKLLQKRLIISLIFAIPLFYISMGHMIDFSYISFIPGMKNPIIFAFTQLALLLPIVLVNIRYFKNGFKTLFSGSPNMDSLIAIGSGASIVYGVYAIYKIGYAMNNGDANLVHTFAMDLYFESAGMILTLITLGKTLEARARRKTTDTISKLMNLAPKTATVERDGKLVRILAENVKVGDVVIVKSGEIVPVDGIVAEGFASVDESAITGESIPVDKNVDCKVTGASICKTGYFKMKAEKVGKDTVISQIIKLVDEATSSKAPIAKLADKVSGIFVPVVIGIAVLTTVIWLICGYPTEMALSMGISVLVISCPCALGLATPTAIMVGTGKGASKGILIKSASALETAHNIDTVVLDKTGTITEGKPEVKDVYAVNDKEEVLTVALSLEKYSEHPIADAIVNEAKKQNMIAKDIQNFKQIPGGGISGEIDGKVCLAGNRRLMEINNIIDEEMFEIGEKMSSDGKTPLYFSVGAKVIGVISVADTLKSTSVQAVKQLSDMGIDVIMLTGDNKQTAMAIAQNTGIKKVISEVYPKDKEKEIRTLQISAKKVAMVGDGINDAPALARADVGIAIGNGTDVAIESADIVLMRNDLTDVPCAIRLSRAVMRNIKQNLFWAFIYNVIGIPVAAGVFFVPFALKLNPMVAAAAMSLSSVFVVSNALRLKRFK